MINKLYFRNKVYKNLYLKNYLNYVLALLLMAYSHGALAKYAVTKATNPSFCTTFPTAYQPVSFSIRETSITSNSGFTKNQSGKTLIIGLSGGSSAFNPGVGTVTATGTEVTITSYTITSTAITVTLNTAATNTELNTISFNNIEIRSTAAGTSNIVRTGGTLLIDNKTTLPRSTFSWGTITASTPAAYSTATATHPNTASAFSGSTDNQILSVAVTISGTCGTVSVSQFNFNTTGSTNPGTDLSAARLYYSGTVNAFSNTTLYGSASNPNGSFSISGSATLSPGTYYFWLVYDIKPYGTAVNGDVIDAQLSSLVVNSVTQTPSNGSPTGSRLISDNLYYSIAGGNWNSTTIWSRTSGGTSCGCAPTAGNGFAVISHAVVLNGSYTIDIVDIRNGGSLTNTSTNALNITLKITTAGTGYFTITGAPWTLNNVYLYGSGTSGSAVSQTITGLLDIEDNTTFQMSAASGTTLTVNGNITVNNTLALSGNNLPSSNSAGTVIFGDGTITGTGIMTWGVSKTIPAGSALTINPIISIATGVTITNKGTVTANNNITGATNTATWVNDENASLTMAGTTSALLTTGTLTATATGNTITYKGSGAQTVKGTTYYNLILKGTTTSTKTLGAATTATNIIIDEAAQLDVSTSNYALTVDNQWINNSTHTLPFNARTGTVTFNGASATITGTGTNTFNNLTISATGSLTAHPTTGKIIVQGNWTNEGAFEHNSSDITFNGTTTISGANTTTFNNIIVNASRTLTLHSTDTEIEGNLTVNGTLSANNGTVYFSGAAGSKTISGTATTIAFTISC